MKINTEASNKVLGAGFPVIHSDGSSSPSVKFNEHILRRAELASEIPILLQKFYTSRINFNMTNDKKINQMFITLLLCLKE